MPWASSVGEVSAVLLVDTVGLWRTGSCKFVPIYLNDYLLHQLISFILKIVGLCGLFSPLAISNNIKSISTSGYDLIILSEWNPPKNSVD